MGYVLRRMIRDGAPAGWSPAMRLVAMEIADHARELPDGTGEAVLPTQVLAERTGVTPGHIAVCLAEMADAGYEMRHAYGTDHRGHAIWAGPNHPRRYKVPRLLPRTPPGGGP